MKITQKQNTTLKLKSKLITRIRLSAFMELKEPQFISAIAEVEQDPLFRKLMFPEDPQQQVIRYHRFSGAGFHSGFTEFKEEIGGGPGDAGLGELLDRRECVNIILRIGRENFERYFLANDTGSVEEAGRACGISQAEAAKLNAFVVDLSIHNEFYYPSTLTVAPTVSYHRVAAIEKGEFDDLTLHFYSPRYYAGKYAIDTAKLEELKRRRLFSPGELSGIGRLLEKMELINARKTTLYRIVSGIVEKQERYLRSGDERALVACPQTELAESLGMDDSLISRAIAGKSVVTPQNEERPLQFFLPSNRDVRRILIAEIERCEPQRRTDREIMRLLRERHGIVVARRTVNACRKGN